MSRADVIKARNAEKRKARKDKKRVDPKTGKEYSVEMKFMIGKIVEISADIQGEYGDYCFIKVEAGEIEYSLILAIQDNDGVPSKNVLSIAEACNLEDEDIDITTWLEDKYFDTLDQYMIGKTISVGYVDATDKDGEPIRKAKYFGAAKGIVDKENRPAKKDRGKVKAKAKAKVIADTTVTDLDDDDI